MTSRRAGWTIGLMGITALAAMIATRSVAQVAPSTQPAPHSLDAIAWAVGDWKLDAKWANGNPLRATATYAWGPGRKSIVVHTFVESDKPGEPPTLRDITIYAVAEDGRLTQYTFPHNGAPRVIPAASTDDGSLLFAWTKPAAPGAEAAQSIPLQHRYTRVSDDRLRWKATMQLKGEWHTTVDGVWTRVARQSQ